MSDVCKQSESYIMQNHQADVTEISAESLSLDLDSLGASSTSVLFSSTTEKFFFSAVRQKLRSFATSAISMVPVGPDGLDEKPLSPRESNQEVASTPPLPPKPSEGNPRPPFSCAPVYVFILIILMIIILWGGVNALLEFRPELIYRKNSSSAAPDDYFNHTLVL